MAARERRKKVASVDKANVLETSRLWREVVSEVAKNYTDIELEHVLIDSCAMHLVTDPRRFGVIVTENMFGDIRSDAAAVLTGSLGTLPSAIVGGEVDLYEPVHGSAPNIAGQNIANPIGSIASVALLFQHTVNQLQAARSVESAIESVLEAGYRTADIAGPDCKKLVSTSEMGDLILGEALITAEVNHCFHAV